MNKLLIICGMVLIMSGCGNDYVDYKCSQEDKAMVKDSFDKCVDRGNYPSRCTSNIKRLICKQVVIKND